MEDDLERFIEEHKMKLARDKADLERDPPYMEIRTKRTNPVSETNSGTTIQENASPSIQHVKENLRINMHKDDTSGLSLPLGEEYERKKHKLKEELRQDYKNYIAQKNVRTIGDTSPSIQGLSLPIGERRSAKERLRTERNRDYNQFLKEKQERERLKEEGRVTQHDRNGSEEPSAQFNQLPPENHQSQKEAARPKNPFKKDAYTSMDIYEEMLERRQEGQYRRLNAELEVHPKQYRRYEDEPEIERRPRRVDEGPRIYESRPYMFEEHHHINKWHPRLTDDELSERRPLRINFASERAMQRQREGRLNGYTEYPEYVVYSHRLNPEQRPPREGRLKEASVEYEGNYREGFSRRPLSAADKAGPQIHESHQTNERSRSAVLNDDGDFATGLLLGVSEKDQTLENRKLRYRQELMKQMEEQRRNKKREKELELRVAASGATDPEKEPDRLKQFGAVNRQNKAQDQNSFPHPAACVPEHTGRVHKDRPLVQERMPPERQRVAFQTPLLNELSTGVPDADSSGALASVSDEYHRGLSSTLGELVAPRVTTVPPPPPPVLSENYRTPYDDAYYYYGARNPLDPGLMYYNPKVEGAQPMPFIGVNAGHLSENLPTYQTHYSTRQSNSDSAPRKHGFFPEEKTSHSKEVTQNYRDILKQQIKEKEEKRKKEREEKEQYEAKLEAEMKNYNPWGKGGGGAPLRDAQGNLITDLKIMHQQNENAYKNPDAKVSQDRRAIVSLDLNLATPRTESNPTPSANKISGFTFAHTSPFARGNVFTEPLSEQQANQQETYKEFLRMQIEEKRRRKEQDREKLQIEEEKEEKRLAEQREKLKQEYEEEQEKKRRREEEQRLKNEEIMRLAEQKKKEAEKKRKEEETKHDEELRNHYEQERIAKLQEEEKKTRPPSPPIPTHRKKAVSRTQRPPSTDSYRSFSALDPSQSRSQSPPVPARRNQLRAHEEKKDVINELSELRKQLRSEQQRLEGKLMDQEREDADSQFVTYRRKEKNADVFDMARFRIPAPVRRPSAKGMDTTNIQNIREFNELKYRDTETREEMRQAYPDPPNNDQTLEIQQQALLREQQKKLNRIQKRRGDLRVDHEVGILNMNPHSTRQFKESSSEDMLKSSLLASESAFIGANGETFPVANLEATTNLQTTARGQRKNKKKALDFDIAYHDTTSERPLVQNLENISLYSTSSLNVDQLRARNEQRMKRLDDLNQNSAGGDFYLADEEDLHNQFTPSPLPPLKNERPDSVETVATDPWLRPGSSDTLKRFIAGQSKYENSSGNALTFNWQELSTAHG